MVGALGVNQAVLFTAVFALGSLLAGLGGALQTAREPANLGMDLTALGDAFVVVVVGGMGSIAGSYVAAVLIAEVKALCIGIGLVHFGAYAVNFSKLTLVAEFLVMAVVLIVRPQGLLGKAQMAVRSTAEPDAPLRPASPMVRVLSFIVLLIVAALPVLARSSPYTLVLGVDVLIAVLFADQPAFHHGAGRHAFIRTRRIFWSWRLRRRAGGEVVCRADGTGACLLRHSLRVVVRCCSDGSPSGFPAFISQC